MRQEQRIRILKLAQAPPTASNPAISPSPTTTTTTQNPTTPVANISIQSLPGYNSQLFSLRPVVITDLNNIVNFINQNISSLSAGKYDYKIVYTNPSISGSEFNNSLKHLVDIGKWIYSTLIYRGPSYTLPQLQNIATKLRDMAQSSSFPDSSATNVQPTLIRFAIEMLNKVK